MWSVIGSTSPRPLTLSIFGSCLQPSATGRSFFNSATRTSSRPYFFTQLTLSRHLKPGGWIEVVEMDFASTSDDGSLPADNYITKFQRYCTEATAKFGRRLDIAQRMGPMLAETGFKKLTETPFKLPMGPWPADKNLNAIGYFHREQFLEGVQGMAMGFFTRALGWTREEVEVFLVSVRQDLNNPKYHSYWRT